MATSPAGKKPASRKTPAKKPAIPVKKVAGKAAPGKTNVLARKPAAKKVAAKAPSAKKPAAKKTATAKRSAVAKNHASSRETLRSAADGTELDNSAFLGLTPKEQRLIDEYLVDRNATQAAIRAGYSANSARQIAHETLSKPYMQLALLNAMKAQQARTQITADDALREIWNVATADTRELVEVRKGCCRCCYGEGHKYQRTVGEMNRDREEWVEKGKNPAEFDEAGGIGFDPLKMPSHECPHCGGDGAARVVLKDTRTMGEKAVALYAGAKQGQYGIEVKFHSKMDALEKLAKHLGLYEKDNQQKTDPLAALLNRIAAGNANGFLPVESDPEAPSASAANAPAGSNTLMPRQDVDDGDQG
jgi:phage terminase small subunit